MSAKKFLLAVTFVPSTIPEMELNWLKFAEGFNAISEQGAFPFRLHVSIFRDELLLTVVDLERSYADTLAVQSRFGIRYNDPEFSYTLTCELEPGVQDCFDIPATPEEAEKLQKRCLAEILAVVGPEQGTAYLLVQGQKPSDGEVPPVVH